MSAEEFVRRIGLAADQNDTHFVFWIGAGCSISSGIPGAASLVTDRWLPQLQRIRGGGDLDLKDWAAQAFPGYDVNDPATKYGEIMGELFIHPEARQREVEALCDGRYPGFGYAVLAALLARQDGLFNVALTTNFDDLIADAMYVFTEARPLVIPDESLAGFIRPTRMRPLVVKVHGDHRLSPRNTVKETGELKKGISEGIHDLLHDRGVIFIGYGGNDAGIAEVLRALPRPALPLGVWWVNPSRPEGGLRSWLEERDAIWVETRGFDELMLLFRDEFDLDPPSPNKFERVFAGYLETYRELSGRVERIPDSDPEATSLKHAAQRADAAVSSWSAVLLQAGRLEDTDPDEAEKVYDQGVKDFPDAAILAVEFGGFLARQGRHKEALLALDRAARAAPQDAFIKATRGRVLAHLERFDEAKAELQSVLDLSPRDIRVRGLYGILLARSGRKEAAERELQHCIELQPSTWDELSQVALLQDTLGRFQSASELHQRVLADRPESANNHSNYARCLIALERIDEARSEINSALKYMPVRQHPTLLEVLYYRFVIGSADDRAEALGRIKAIIAEGWRSPFWEFGVVTEYGDSVRHPDAEWLKLLAAVIGGSRSADVLDKWARWSSLPS